MLTFHDYPECEAPLRFFEAIAAIPHPSGITDKIADYLVDFAKERGLAVTKDAANNVLIRKEGTPGYEDHPTVILQGHTDMVAQKDPDCKVDMNTEGLTLYREGDFLRARGTTLGGDDGIAIAYALAILDSRDIPHPPIEALFTSDEEIGLIGATRLSAEGIRGRRLINIDSDEEGVFTVGCAGGVRCDLSLPITRVATEEAGYRIRIGGLLGGHSGIEIDKGRANAILMLGELLCELGALGDITLAHLEGGTADNAIPAQASATVRTSVDPEKILPDFLKKMSERFGDRDPAIKITCEVVEHIGTCLDEKASARILSLLSSLTSGVVAMSEELPGLPETSKNVGIALTEKDAFHLTVSVRSAKEAEKEKVVLELKKIAKDHGAAFDTRGEYPAWEYRGRTPFIDTTVSTYARMYGEEPKVVVIHAGLECGILSQKLPGLECISIGPNNYDIHTPRERLSLSSTARVWEFIKEVLKGL